MANRTAQIVRAGLLVGTLDILSAFIYYFAKTHQTHFFSVLRYVASGLLGKKALSGGDEMAMAGLFLHYLIAFSFTIFFFELFPRIKALSRNSVLTGIVYGIFIWVVMNLIVVPLSNIPKRPFVFVNVLINVIILIVCIGIPLSYMAKTFYWKRSIDTTIG